MQESKGMIVNHIEAHHTNGPWDCFLGAALNRLYTEEKPGVRRRRGQRARGIANTNARGSETGRTLVAGLPV